MLKDKRGLESLVAEYVMFFIISIIFFSFFLFILNKVGNGAGIYEQAYAKKIALMIDGAKPGMAIEINVEDLFKFSEKPNIFIGKKDGINIVKVGLGSGEGYSYSYFSENKIKEYFIILNDKKLRIVFEEKK